jgi:hypothetical protein
MLCSNRAASTPAKHTGGVLREARVSLGRDCVVRWLAGSTSTVCQWCVGAELIQQPAQYHPWSTYW